MGATTKADIQYSSGPDSEAAPDCLWREFIAELRRRKETIDSEIRCYPTPIPRCDAQFNHLYELRGELARELDLAQSAAPCDREDCLAQMRRLLASAPRSDDPMERNLRSRIDEALNAIQRARGDRP
jgi:hypothetical protein